MARFHSVAKHPAKSPVRARNSTKLLCSEALETCAVGPQLLICDATRVMRLLMSTYIADAVGWTGVRTRRIISFVKAEQVLCLIASV